MSVGFAVELADLRGYARQVERAGEAAGAMAAEAPMMVGDGNFGRILELITDDYEKLVPRFIEVLGQDHERLTETAAALRATARDYARTDARVAQEFGIGAAIDNDRSATGFRDVVFTSLSCPAVRGYELPTISFGFPADQVFDLCGMAGLPDPRGALADKITGNVDKAAGQAATWKVYAAAADAISQNLASGGEAIGQTWSGAASAKALARNSAWVSSLSGQAEAMEQMSEHLKDMADQAVTVAETVCDAVGFFVSVVSAGWTYAYIPGWGQWKLVKTVKDAAHLLWNAYNVLSVFLSFLGTMKSALTGIYQGLTAADLPPAPTAAH